MAHFN